MERLLGKNQQYFYENSLAQIIHGDSFKLLTKLKSESIDMIFADPLYFLSNDGMTCKGGSIWISGTLHNIYSIGMALEQEGFKIINNITWQKTNPPPNLACRCFSH